MRCLQTQGLLRTFRDFANLVERIAFFCRMSSEDGIGLDDMRSSRRSQSKDDGKFAGGIEVNLLKSYHRRYTQKHPGLVTSSRSLLKTLTLTHLPPLRIESIQGCEVRRSQLAKVTGSTAVRRDTPSRWLKDHTGVHHGA